ncbi:MAG: acylphosphatase [Betaproteobacteria bacterium]|nr:acylphosphatase [Betaproteobacteria bacterium]
MNITRHLRITGRVQGVAYRYSAVRQARELGVTGWIRNRRDGSVEAVVQGAPAAVEAMIVWTRSGPPGARVTDVQVTDGEGEFGEFSARPTE